MEASSLVVSTVFNPCFLDMGRHQRIKIELDMQQITPEEMAKILNAKSNPYVIGFSVEEMLLLNKFLCDHGLQKPIEQEDRSGWCSVWDGYIDRAASPSLCKDGVYIRVQFGQNFRYPPIFHKILFKSFTGI